MQKVCGSHLQIYHLQTEEKKSYSESTSISSNLPGDSQIIARLFFNDIFNIVLL